MAEQPAISILQATLSPPVLKKMALPTAIPAIAPVLKAPLPAPLCDSDVANAVAVQEDTEQGGVEQGVEHPGADAAVAASGATEVHPHDSDSDE